MLYGLSKNRFKILLESLAAYRSAGRLRSLILFSESCTGMVQKYGFCYTSKVKAVF
jgi:hypothetical protein